MSNGATLFFLHSHLFMYRFSVGRRVTRPPGGPSSISFVSADAPPCGPSSRSSSAAKPKPQLQDTKPQQTPAPPPHHQEPSTAPSINAGKANKAVHTSSKVLNPPGGKTSISFFWNSWVKWKSQRCIAVVCQGWCCFVLLKFSLWWWWSVIIVIQGRCWMVSIG